MPQLKTQRKLQGWPKNSFKFFYNMLHYSLHLKNGIDNDNEMPLSLHFFFLKFSLVDSIGVILLQPGFSGVETRQELLHSHLPLVWLPWASSHLLLCPRETGGEQPPCPRRSEAPSLTRGLHSAPPRGPLLPASALSAALLWSLRGGGRSLSHTPPRRSSGQLRLPGRTGRACAGNTRGGVQT